MTEATSVVNLPELTVPGPGEGGDFQVPEPDVYELVIAEILETRQAQFNGQIKEGKYQVRLKFAVVGGEFDGVWFKQWLGYSMHEKSFLRAVLMAIRNNRPLEEGKPVDLVKYVGKPFRGVVKVDEVPSRTEPGRMMRFAKVTEAMPVRKGAAAAAPAPAPAPAPAADTAPDDEDPFEDL